MDWHTKNTKQHAHYVRAPNIQYFTAWSTFEIATADDIKNPLITGKLCEEFLFGLHNSFGILLICFANIKNYLQIT
jgi:hypothetical protein